MDINEILFYGGIIAAVITVVAGIVFYITVYIYKLKLGIKFDNEYGKIKRMNGKE